MILVNHLRDALAGVGIVFAFASVTWSADSRFAHSDSDARHVHWIELYDADNRKITPESDRPYSSLRTCGRCHDYETISHGWHFNAFDPNAAGGRDGEPWIWTDPRTGTQLPLSYRDWSHTYNPKSVGISSWEMTRQFGSRLPGVGPGGEDADATEVQPEPETEEPEGEAADQPDADQAAVSRWPLSGPLEIDCMVCHAVPGAYDFNQRREQIEQQNFAWAATAALRLGSVDGNVSRIKDDANPDDEATKEKLPKVSYDPSRFSSDGTVFMDLIREPASNSCYQCHSNRTATESGLEPRWIHDEDVHLRAGMICADCHRNGIGHHIVRGFDGEQNPSGLSVNTLSCAGCHLGSSVNDPDAPLSPDIDSRAGRLGAPKPLHAGLPPLHFEKLSCTACHGGPAPRDQALRIMTSLAHGLGAKEHRTGMELPAIAGPVFAKGPDGRVYPNRVMWPAFWGSLEGESIRPIPPDTVYDVTRRALRVRSDFVTELLEPKLSSTELKELLGEERAKADASEWSDEEKAKVDARQAELGRTAFDQKVSAALEAIENELSVKQAVYVSSGFVYARGSEPETLQTLPIESDRATKMVQWPMAHNVRPAGWSLGVGGCLECHSDSGKIFASTVAAVGPGPDGGESIPMATIQEVAPLERLAWNEMFQGRKSFKYIIGGSISILLMTLLIGIGALASHLSGRRQQAT